VSEPDAAETWEARYAERDQIWSGKPNDALVSAATGLSPGTALDLGCGEGGDSVWLAEQGWHVTAVDIAPTAVARAQALAARRHVPDEQIRWMVEDLRSWSPPDRYDLVSACFLHSWGDFPRTEVLRRAASTVKPGGHLLVVGHAAAPPWSQGHHHEHHFPAPAEDVADLQLEPPGWEVVISEVRSRDAVGPDEQRAHLDDAVILARRSA